jgi:hypothetical protein
MDFDAASQLRVALQAARDRSPIGVEVKQAANALGNKEERARIGEFDASKKCVIGLVERNFQPTAISMQRNGAPVAAVCHGFDTRNGAKGEKRQHRLPVIRRAKTQAEQILILGLARPLPGDASELRRSAVIDFAKFPR